MTENGLVERIALTDDRQLLVRQVALADAQAFSVLYEGLDDEDRYRRFFGDTGPLPSSSNAVASEPSGGARLVAELIEHGAATIVGEAGYAPLPNGMIANRAMLAVLRSMGACSSDTTAGTWCA